MVRSIGARWALPVGLFATLTLLCGVAVGQDRDPAAAQALFDAARELMSQGKFAEACPKLQESNRLDPGVGTRFHLADCYERSGRVASAWATFLEVASIARTSNQADREKVATQRAAKLQARLPRLVINVPESSKTNGLEIRRDGMLVGSAQWGTPVAVDPGEVELTVTAPGKQSLRQTLRLEEGRTASYNLPSLAPDSSAAPPPVAPPPVAPGPPAAAAPPVASPRAPAPPPESNQPVAKGGNGPWIITLAGVGVVGLGVGGAYSLMAKSKYNESTHGCDPADANSCSQTGVNLRNSARTKGDIATFSFIAGGAALAGAGIVWLASGSSSDKHAASPTRLRATPALGPNLAALFLQGRF